MWEIASGKELADFKGHIMPVTGVAFDPKGAYLGSAAADGTARLRNLKRNAAERVFRGHVGQVFDLCFSPSGREIATAGWDRTIRLWYVPTGQELLTLRGSHQSVYACAISPDAKSLVGACGDGTVRVWNVDLALHLQEMIPRWASSASDMDNQLERDDLQEVVGYLASHVNEESSIVGGHKGLVLAVALSPDGSLAATAGMFGMVRLWEVASFRERFQFKTHQNALGLAFSPDGKWLAVPDGPLIRRDANSTSIPASGTVTIWNVATGKVVRTIRHAGAPVIAAAFSPDGRYLARATGFPAEYLSQVTKRRPVYGTIRLYDLKQNREAWSRPAHANMVVSVSFSGDSSRLVSSGQDAAVQVWDVAAGRKLAGIPAAEAKANRVAIRPDGSQLAVASITGEVLIWDIAARRRLFKLPGHGDRATHLVYTPDGNRVVSAGGDGTVRVWNPDSGQALLTLRGHVNQVFGLGVSADGRKIASARFDGIVKVWDARLPSDRDRLKFSEVVFRDDFNRNAPGPRWKSAVGAWSVDRTGLPGANPSES